MAERHELKIPDLGDFADVEVIEVLVGTGDSVEVEDGILTLETDKAAMDVPSTVGGTVVEVTVSVGDKVNEGDVYAVIESAAGAADASAAADEPTPDDAAAAAEPPADDAEADAPAAPASAEKVEIRVPDIGDFSDVDVIDVLVSTGDEIDVETGLISIETDKAAMDVPSTHAGTVLEVTVAVGDKVSEGDVIVRLESSGGDAPAEAATAADERPASADADSKQAGDSGEKTPVDAAPAARASRAERPPASLPPVDEAGFSKAHAGPSARRLARELGVNLIDVRGSGRKGRIVKDDIKAWVKERLAGGGASGAPALPAVPAVDFAKFGPVEEEALSRIQKISGPRLSASWLNLPHVTQHDLADITDLEERRQELKGPAKERGIGLTPLAFVIRAVLLTLDEFPRFAASLSPGGDALVIRKYRHIGFAADTPGGLVVPVIRDADRLDVYELAEALGTLSAAAREGKLKADQMQGAVFTISSLGGIGGTAFTPIVNAPEVAILGVSRSSMQPVWDGTQFEPRLMLPLSLSYDHRVIDGAAAVRFTTRLGEHLGNVQSLIEATP